MAGPLVLVGTDIGALRKCTPGCAGRGYGSHTGVDYNFWVAEDERAEAFPSPPIAGPLSGNRLHGN